MFTFPLRLWPIPCATTARMGRFSNPYGNCITMVPRFTNHYLMHHPGAGSVEPDHVHGSRQRGQPQQLRRDITYLLLVYPALNNWPLVHSGTWPCSGVHAALPRNCPRPVEPPYSIRETPLTLAWPPLIVAPALAMHVGNQRIPTQPAPGADHQRPKPPKRLATALP